MYGKPCINYVNKIGRCKVCVIQFKYFILGIDAALVSQLYNQGDIKKNLCSFCVTL